MELTEILQSITVQSISVSQLNSVVSLVVFTTLATRVIADSSVEFLFEDISFSDIVLQVNSKIFDTTPLKIVS